MRYAGISSFLLLFSLSTAFAQAVAPVEATISFECLWWSTAQMANFNPNAPPAKATPTPIKTWEYGDPVGTPHPDTVDTIITLRNSGEMPLPATIAMTVQWRTGPQRRESAARWSAPIAVKGQSVTIPAGGSINLRIPVDIAAKMKELESREHWPWVMRVQAVVTGATGSVLARKQADLPIRPGD